MKVTCPYCNCHYDIRPEILKEPIGNVKLGFGWWLRCYKCQKKFWLSNTKVAQLTATPIKANRTRQVKNISKLKINLKKKSNKTFYIISSIIVIISLFGYYKRDVFKNIVVNRISSITKSTITSLQLANIAYRLETVDNQNKIYITGFILNNTATIIPINGLKVVIYSNGKEMTSWKINPDAKNAIPGDKIFFSSEQVIDKIYPNIQVGVSIL
ncbi:MAG: hypothetical protein IJ848_02680 [Alphaproteobacteria bacterium]|nr:hypothetical protein [Alphaproteobacteria bacterium]